MDESFSDKRLLAHFSACTHLQMRAFGMAALRGFLSLAILFITIISSSLCQSISNVGETSVSRYQRFTTKPEEISVSNTPQCGLILATIVDQIADLYMPEKNVMCILTDKLIENNCLVNAFDEFLKLGTRNVITMVLGARKIDFRKVIYQKPTIYFLLGIDLSAVLEPLINYGKMSGTWNPRGLYISIAESKEEAANIMTSLWKKFVYKVIVLIFHNNTLDTVEAYTWRPYYPSNYCGPPTIGNIIKLGKFTKTLQFEKETDTEPGMIPETFGNCPLNVSFNIWKPFVFPPEEDQSLSLEVKLIETVCEKIGIRINPYYHNLTLIKEPSEAWAGTIIPRSAYVKIYEISMPYIQDSFVWVVPCGDDIHLFNPADGFPSSLWLPSAVALSIAAVSLRASGNKHWILSGWGSLWEQSNYKVAKKVRWIWGCWLFLCLHLSVAYKTALVSHLTNPMTNRGIHNQSELLESGLELGFLVETELWFNKEDEIEKKILEQYVPCESMLECYKEIPTGKAVLMNQMYVNYLMGQRVELGSISEKVRQLPSSLNYKVTMLYAKGHAVLPSFDKFLLLTLQGGFVRHWMKEIEEMQTRTNTHKLNFTREQKLTFDQVSGGFQILNAGFIISGVIFVCEIFHRLLMEPFYKWIKAKGLG